MKFSKQVLAALLTFGSISSSLAAESSEPVYETPVIRKANNVKICLINFLRI